VAYRPGSLSEVLTEHYRRAHPKRSASLRSNPPWAARITPRVPSPASIAPDDLARAGRESASGHGMWPPVVRGPHMEPPFWTSWRAVKIVIQVLQSRFSAAWPQYRSA